MNRFVVALAALAAVALSLAPSAAAKTDAPKVAPVLRCAKSYAAALAEAKDRGCVVFVTIHEDG